MWSELRSESESIQKRVLILCIVSRNGECLKANEREECRNLKHVMLYRAGSSSRGWWHSLPEQGGTLLDFDCC
jgi:hypothetical protein